MKNIWHRMALALTMIAAGCAGGGGYDPGKAKKSIEEMRAFARTKVKDPARAEKVTALIDSYEKQIEAINDLLQSFLGQTQALNADYDATLEKFQKLADDFSTARKPLRSSLLDTVMAMKAATTPEEWEHLAKLENEALKANLQRERVEKKG